MQELGVSICKCQKFFVTLYAKRSDMLYDQAENINQAAWRELVAASETGTWFQSPDAYAFYEMQRKILEPFVYAVGRDESLTCVCVGYITYSSVPLARYMTRRAIIIGGVCVADDVTEAEVSELLQAVRAGLQSRAIYIETRNFNDYSRWRQAFEAAGFDYQRHLDFLVDCRNEDTLWQRLSDNRKRQIRKAQTSGVVVCEAQSESEIEAWYKVLAELYRRKVKTPLFPLAFFMQAYKQHTATFLLVKNDERILGGSMLVKDGKRVYEWYECGLNAQNKEQYPSVMATYAGMQFAHQKGCHIYDMMGAGQPGVSYGVRDFKAEFGGEQVEFGRYLCICNRLLYRLGTIGVRLLKRKNA